MDHLLTVRDVSHNQVDLFHARAHDFGRAIEQGRVLPQLRGKTLGQLFPEPSTRTKVSFQLAAGKLGAQTIQVTSDSSSLAKGESLIDTVKTLTSYRLDCLVIRSPFVGGANTAAQYANCPVINAGDGTHEHPTQALADLFVLRQHYADIRGLEVWLVGDVMHSRVARSVIHLLQAFGAKVTLCGPPRLIPPASTFDCSILHTLDRIETADVIYALRPQQERMNHEVDSFSVREYQHSFRLEQNHLSEHQLLLHPGPINRGLEISAELADHERCLASQQVRAGLLVRIALLDYFLK